MFTNNFVIEDCLPPILDALVHLHHLRRAKYKLASVLVLSLPTPIENGCVIKN